MRLALPTLLFFAVTALADDGFKKLMPKNQSETVTKIEQFLTLSKKIDKEPNGLRRKELEGELTELGKVIRASLDERLADDGLTGWIGLADVRYENRASFQVPGVLQIWFTYEGMGADQTGVIRSLRQNAPVKFSVEKGARPRIQYTLNQDGLSLSLNGSSLKAAEKAKAKK